MKKMKSVLAMVMVVASLCTLLVGCGGGSGSGSDALVGTWVMSESGISVDLMTLNKDGTGTMLGDTLEIKWSATDKEITLEMDGQKESTAYTLKGDELTLEIEGTNYTLTKKK